MIRFGSADVSALLRFGDYLLWVPTLAVYPAKDTI